MAQVMAQAAKDRVPTASLRVVDGELRHSGPYRRKIEAERRERLGYADNLEGAKFQDIRLTYIGAPCPLCGEYLDIATHVHAEKHNMTKEAFVKTHFPESLEPGHKAHKYGDGLKWVRPPAYIRGLRPRGSSPSATAHSNRYIEI